MLSKLRNSFKFVPPSLRLYKPSRGANNIPKTELSLPLLFGVGTISVYLGWKFLPYGKMVANFTISENIWREKFYHAVILAPFSFMTTGHLALYFPFLLVGLHFNSKLIGNSRVMLLHLLTTVIAASTTYYYEKMYLNQKLMVPKCVGACSALTQASCLFVLKPDLMLKSRFLPFGLILAVLIMHELNEYKMGYVNEISRPSHIASIGLGIVYGALMRRFLI